MGHFIIGLIQDGRRKKSNLRVCYKKNNNKNVQGNALE